MKHLPCVWIGIAVTILLGGVLSGCQPGEPAPPAEPSRQGEAAAGEIAQKTCPVMGRPINPEVYVDHEGRRIYFCCQACVAKFKADPEKYLAKVDEELKGGPAETPPQK